MDTLCFCGGSPVFEEWEVGDQTLFSLSCCRCKLRTEWFYSKKEAEDDWTGLQSNIEEHVNGDQL